MAIICIEDVPPGSYVGLNLHSWRTGPNFRGLRDVPDGIQCLHLTINSINTTKFAVWLVTTADTVVAYKWDKFKSLLIGISADHVPSISPLFLMEHPLSSDVDGELARLTQHLPPDLLPRFVDLGSLVTSTTTSNTDTHATEIEGVENHTEQDASFTFTPIDLKRSWRPGAIGREVTEMSLDKSWLLKDTLRRSGESNLLAEFTFCFASVLLFTSVTAFEQWNKIFVLVCGIKSGLYESHAFVEKVLLIVHEQVKALSSDLYSEIFSLTVPTHLARLQASVEDVMGSEQDHKLKGVHEQLEILLDYLHHSFGDDDTLQQSLYPVDDEGDEVEDDERPVVVDT